MKLKLKAGADVLGNPINAGDYIVYGAAKGRCAGLNIGKVIETKDRGKTVKAAAVQVSFGEYLVTGMDSYAAHPKPRVVYLGFPERICVIPSTSVNDALKEMLNYT